MGKSYEDLGFGPRMVKNTSKAGTRDYTNVLEESVKVESTPYLNRTAIGKGTLQTTLGGLTEFKDTTGGTTIFTYNPDTGVVTIIGSLVANQVNTGTYTNIVLAGTPNLVGTLTNGVINNPTIGTPGITGGTYTSPTVTNGTLNPTAYQTSGSAGSTGSIIYVKSADFAGSTTTLGTLNFANGINLTFN